MTTLMRSLQGFFAATLAYALSRSVALAQAAAPGSAPAARGWWSSGSGWSDWGWGWFIVGIFALGVILIWLFTGRDTHRARVYDDRGQGPGARP